MSTKLSMLLIWALACPWLGAAQDRAPDSELLFGGCGGVYFLAEPGQLEIEVVKRDLNRSARFAELRAILVGPDRRVLQEVAIPDDGRGKGQGPGPLQRASMSVRVDRKGVYALNITVSQDRYGQEMVWGFRTNCPRYLVETARGHRDERHREPIVLAGSGEAATVCFMPRRGAFHISASGLAGKGGNLQVVDARGELVRAAAVVGGKAECAIRAGVHRGAVPWSLRLSSARATITIEGVTQWERSDPYPDLCVWTPDPRSWFPLLEHRWLLMPYHRLVVGRSRTEREVAFEIHNNGGRAKTVRLDLEFPAAPWSVRLERERVRIAPGRAERVAVHLAIPPDGGVVHIRATPEDASGFTTYSTLEARAGEPPALRIPLRLKPYQHENALLGYLPAYPTASQPYFDPANRPFVVLGRDLAAARNGSWTTTRLPGAALTSKCAFDRAGGVYLIAATAGGAALLYSADGGRTFEAHAIPGRRGSYDLEQFSGHNTHDGPPPFVRFTRTATDPKLRWRRLNDLELFVPRKVGGRIEIGAPIPISKACIGLSAHSGIPSSIVSRGAKVHVAWGEATEPGRKVAGVPTYVVTYDRGSRRLGKPALIGYGPPPNDVHNSPSITMDSGGFLHVLIGTHGRPFQYVRSRRPNDAGAGWSEPVTAGDGLRQTYIGFVCGKDDTLHTVFRLWRNGRPYVHSSHAVLAYQRKRPGKPWEPPRILVVAPFSEYSIFYHRLTIDRRGRLFLSKDYWSTYWFYRNDQRGNRGHWRALLISPDGGESWKLAADEDLLE